MRQIFLRLLFPTKITHGIIQNRLNRSQTYTNLYGAILFSFVVYLQTSRNFTSMVFIHHAVIHELGSSFKAHELLVMFFGRIYLSFPSIQLSTKLTNSRCGKKNRGGSHYST
ncbi:ZYRO0E10296p [Zygosaccharomyces rouxii]|uniref:ZYRO0E10296p n=1 Tax=Zygosaccharomyces rouxii (strain ATCC 2623 / CBS 732 / NBRC 1130 / NCYC 568 / NRRL Y-229) TaxID=559307 RepID=C5E501_ZYGRC|nr:uncharacterized protein ZYRO0E10296g [Zygosaccharomyces rouxii]KAH9198027.1 hypothetical protein LQ764DRAFT_182669 [Zygosaccharomyces rouxii]CAR31112.1 ZYRO0E10296p [Zygosaccharomyces rouxii]